MMDRPLVFAAHFGVRTLLRLPGKIIACRRVSKCTIDFFVAIGRWEQRGRVPEHEVNRDLPEGFIGVIVDGRDVCVHRTSILHSTNFLDKSSIKS